MAQGICIFNKEEINTLIIKMFMPMKKLPLLTVLFALAQINGTYAQGIVEVPLSERLDVSTAVFEGKVLDQTSFWNPEHTRIFTANNVEVYKVFKGAVSVSNVEVIYEGGIVGNDMETVSHGLELTKGDYGIFLLQSASVINSPSAISINNKFEPFAGIQSFIIFDLADRVAVDPFKTYTYIENQLYSEIQNHLGGSYKVVKPFDLDQLRNRNAKSPLAVTISGFTPATITGGTFSVLTINGSGFGTNTGSAKVEFKNVDNGGGSYVAVAATSAAVISWTDTQIKVQVPPTGGSGTIRVTDNTGLSAVSSATLNVKYGEKLANGTGEQKLANINTTGGYTFAYNTSFNSNAPAVAAFERALVTWKCNCFVNYKHVGTSTVACQGDDGVGVITFDNSCVLGSGILATAFNFYSGCGTPTAWTLKGWDMKISSNATGKGWNYGPGTTSGGQYDLESVTLHELGHSILQTHTNDKAALMYYQSFPNNQIRIPNANESECADHVMTRSVINNACGPKGLVLVPASTCSAIGINETTANNPNVAVYPNPFDNSTTLHLDASIFQSGPVSLTLFDILGNQVKNPVNVNAENFELYRDGLSNGIYFYELINTDKVFATGKLILSGNK